MSVKTPPLIIMDYETGGFDSTTDAITEFAAICIDGDTFKEIARFESLLAPYSSDLLYNADALKATNISMNQINSGVDFKTFTKDVLAFFKKCNIYSHSKYKPIIVGHNITFDIAFLHQMFFHMGKKIQDYLNSSKDHFGNYQPKYLDTQILAMAKWGNDPNMLKHTLTDCVTKIGEEIVNAHRAINDVEATKTLLISFLKDLRNESARTSLTQDVDELENFREKFNFSV